MSDCSLYLPVLIHLQLRYMNLVRQMSRHEGDWGSLRQRRAAAGAAAVLLNTSYY